MQLELFPEIVLAEYLEESARNCERAVELLLQELKDAT